MQEPSRLGPSGNLDKRMSSLWISTGLRLEVGPKLFRFRATVDLGIFATQQDIMETTYLQGKMNQFSELQFWTWVSKSYLTFIKLDLTTT